MKNRPTLELVSWNMQGGSHPQSLEYFFGTVMEHMPDVICLQEVYCTHAEGVPE